MTMFSTRRLAVFVLLAILVLTLSGCWNPFAPKKGDPVPIKDAEYRERLAPEDVIHNLKTAYIYKDADQYLDCLSEDFIFYPSEADLQNPDPQNPMPDEWYKTDERQMHDNMFTGPREVESISLTLTNVNVVYNEGLPGPEDDTYDHIESVDLMVNLYGDLSYLATADSEYWFRVDDDQQGEEGEIWWEIYAWFDLSEAPGGRGDDGRQDPMVERVSLGQLKSMFR